MIEELEQAHKHSIRNRAAVEASNLCACFYCLECFDRRDVVEWTDAIVRKGKHKGRRVPKSLHTAICPHCGIDAVLPTPPQWPISKAFLQRMHEYWFDGYADEIREGI